MIGGKRDSLKKNSFRPSQYFKNGGKNEDIIQVSSENNENNKDVYRKITKLDLLKEACRQLKPFWKTPIKQFNEEANKNFEIITQFVGYHRNKSTYNIVYETIQKEFGDSIKNIEAGTLSGYIGGCTIEKYFKSTPGCGIYCANAMPLIDKTEGCQFPVMIAQFQNDQFIFHVVQDNVENRKNTLIYYAGEEIPKFNLKEKEALKSWNIEKVNIITFKNNEYKEIYGGFIHVDELPNRSFSSIFEKKSNEKEKEKEKKESSNYYIFLIILFVFFVLALFYFFYWKKK